MMKVLVKVLVLVLLRVLSVAAVTPPSIGTGHNVPAIVTTFNHPGDVTTELNEQSSASVGFPTGESMDEPTRLQIVATTSQLDSVTSTDSPDLQSSSESSELYNIRNKSNFIQVDDFSDPATQKEGNNTIPLADPTRISKMMNNFNESESNAPRTLTTSGFDGRRLVVNEGDLSASSTRKDEFYPDNNEGITGISDISDESTTMHSREEQFDEFINNSKEFRVMNEENSYQKGHSNISEGLVLLNAEDVLLRKITEINLNKCFCPSHHLLDEASAECVATQTSFVQVLMNPITSETYSAPEARFRQVQVRNLSCSDPLWLYQGDYQVLLSGDVQHKHYDTIIKSSQFCMEDKKFKDGHREWIIMTCLEPPRIPKCCARNQLYDVGTMTCIGGGLSSSSQLNDTTLKLPRAGDNSTWFTIPVEKDLSFPTVPAETHAAAGTPSCSGGRKLVAVQVDTDPQKSVTLANSLHDVHLHVFHSDFKIYKHFKNTEYCVDWSTKSEEEVGYVAVFCYEDPFEIHRSQCSLSKNCIRKCCPSDEIIDMFSLGCTAPLERQYLYKPRFYHHSWTEGSTREQMNISYEVVHGEPLCTFIDAKHKEDFFLLDDGTAYFPLDHLRYTSEYYCVDAQQGNLNQTDAVILYCGEAGTPYGNTCWRLRVALYPALLTVTCVFLLVTLVVYMVLPELQRLTISGRSLPSHVLALFVASCSMLAIFLGKLNESDKIGLCISMAFLTQFCLLATFFWLNVMCFEMWYRIRIQPTLAVSVAESRQKYKLYSLYGWGLPALITLITGIVQAAAPMSSLTPNFGNPYCWFRPKEPAVWIYFSGFVVLLCLANIFFFLDLAQITVKQCLGSTLIHHSTQQHMGRILLCLKLFIVMGVTWVFEEISFNDDACARWFAADVMNLLRGPFVFLSVVSTRTVLAKLKNKVPSLCHCVGGGGRPSFVPPSSKGFAVVNPKRKAASLHLDSIRRYPTCRLPSESGSRDSLASVKTEETSFEPKSESSINPKADESSSVYQRESSCATQSSECSSGNESSQAQLQLDPAAESQSEELRQQGEVGRSQEVDEVNLSLSQNEVPRTKDEHEKRQVYIMPSSEKNVGSQDAANEDIRKRSPNDVMLQSNSPVTDSPISSRSVGSLGKQSDNNESDGSEPTAPHDRNIFTVDYGYASLSSEGDHVTDPELCSDDNDACLEDKTHQKSRDEA